jgi:hypothetical protein
VIPELFDFADRGATGDVAKEQAVLEIWEELQLFLI